MEAFYVILEHIFENEAKDMKFMHMSDVHLGVVPDVGREWSKRRQQDIWDSFAEAVLQAGRQSVDFLLISGDLFHKQPLKRELKEVNYLFGQIPWVKVVLMAGNHDHLQPKSYYLDFPWEENVYFFEREEISSFDFPEKNVTIYGLSYWHQQICERLYEGLSVSDENRINILLAHGGTEKQIPFLPKRILEKGIDYIAAGHIHKAAHMVGASAVMAGSLEPTDCNDTGPHGYWIGEITKEGRKVFRTLDFYPVKKCEYKHEIFSVTEDTTQYELEQMVKNRIKEGESYMLYRIFLEGCVNPDVKLDFSRLEQMNRVVDVTINLQPDYDYEKILKDQPDSLLGRYIARMEKQPQNAVTKKALEFGVNALLGHNICR